MNRRTSFFNILITYIIVLTVPLLIGIAAYRTSYRTVADNYENSRQALLQQALVHIEGNMRIADTVANGIVFDPKLRSFSQMVDPFEGTSLYKVIESMKLLDKFMIGGTVIHDYYVIYENGAVLGRGRAFHLNRFYPGQFEVKGMDYDDWFRMLSDDMSGSRLFGNRGVAINGLPQDVLTYVKPLFESTEKKSVLVILLNIKDFSNIFKEFPLGENGWVAMVDGRGEVLSSYPDERGMPGEAFLSRVLERSPEIGEGDSLFTMNYVDPSQGDWFLVSAMPKGLVSSEVIKVRNVIVICVVLTLLLGGAFVFLMALRTFKPVKLLIDDNNSLKKVLEAQKPYLNQAFLGRLIRGEFRSEREISHYLEQTGIELAGKGFSIVLVHLEEGDAPLAVSIREQVIMLNIIRRKSADQRVYVRPHDVHDQTILFVHPSRDQEANSLVINGAVQRWEQVARSGLSSRRFWGVGSSVASPMEISRSYDEALLALNYGRTHGSEEPVRFIDLPKGEGEAFRPQNLENRLRSLVSGGFSREIGVLIDDLIERYVNDNPSDSSSALALGSVLFANTVMLLNTNLVRDTDALDSIREDLTKGDLNRPAQLCPLCRQVLVSMARLVSLQKTSHNEPLIKRIEGFLKENYSRKDLNLAVVSERFGISETYLSHFFKEQTGTNFSEYLRDFRIGQAQDFLKKGKAGVTEVADLAGFGSYATFARIFKQIHGISAREYREQFKS